MEVTYTILAIVFIIVVSFFIWGVYIDKKKQAEALAREKTRERERLDAYKKKYGYSREEIITKINTSPNVEILAKKILEITPLPTHIDIYKDHIEVWNVSKTKDIPFSNLGFSAVPADCVYELTKALEKFISSRFFLQRHSKDDPDDCFSFERRPDPQENVVHNW